MTSIPVPPTPQRPAWRLLETVPATVYSRLIVHRPYQDDRNLAFFYSESANRLASSFEGNPIDDVILLPFLTLYRQAFELELKSFIKDLASLRREHYEPSNADLDHDAVAKKLRVDIRHNIHKLINELIAHYEALNLTEEFPAELKRFLLLLHDADTPGTNFRYSDNLPDVQSNIDFPDLAQTCMEQFALLQALEDWVMEPFANISGGDNP